MGGCRPFARAEHGSCGDVSHPGCEPVQLWNFPHLEVLELEGEDHTGRAFCISSSLPCKLLALHLRCMRLDFEVALKHCRHAVSWLTVLP